MYICICNAVTDKQIRKAAKAGVRNLRQLQKELGVATNCGCCKAAAAEILTEHRQAERPVGPRIHAPSAA